MTTQQTHAQAGPRVGDLVWIFDECRRHYRRDDQGREYGSPIYREHFVRLRIIGETRQSWLVGSDPNYPAQYRLPKRREGGRWPGRLLYFFSEAEVERDCWVQDERPRLIRAVSACDDYDQLRAIDAVLSRTEKSP